ncbi:MAG: ParB N-terminal domain-containing protein [Desulfobacterales bacterium]|nr:ParB N-terminal domain-containing protein [Desulfobacterales bacterium]
MEKHVLPKIGDKIPVEKFFVSKMNMRVDEPFGESKEDQALIKHFRGRAEIVQPFKARPEGDGYGAVVGRRRFLALKEAGRLKELTVGQHVLIAEMSDKEAMDASLKENLEEFHKTPDPISRAKAISAYLSRLPTGLRGLARSWGISHSTLSEYLKILDLNPAMQETVRKGQVSFRDGLATARLKLEDEVQTKLAKTAETQGVDTFKRELARHMAGKGKRGIPAGIYIVVRSIFDKRSRDDLRYYKTLEKLAKEKEIGVADYAKQVIVDHIKSVV